MVTRSQFLGGGALAMLATALSACSAEGSEPHASEQTGQGASAPSPLQEIASRLLMATEHGVVADAVTPINTRVNELIGQLTAAGGGTLIFPPGIYAVDASGIELGNQVTIMGMGEATQFLPVGDWHEPAGVFRIGSPTSANAEPVYRTGLFDLSIKGGADPNEHIEPRANVIGIYYNTYNGESPLDPDAAHRIAGLTLWDLDTGIVLKGKDDQGMTVERVRGRRFLNAALMVGEEGVTGGADNMFSMIDLSSANRGMGQRATVEVYASNTSWSQVKVWYSKRPVELEGDSPSGAGFFVKGTRNTFSQCDAQDNGGHGFVIKWGNNSFTNCVADSNGWAENLSGSAKAGEAHGFHVSQDAPGTQLIGCMAFDRLPDSPGQGTGFWVHEKNTSTVLIGNAYNNVGENVVARGLPREHLLTVSGKQK
ncbi:hypothetical protein [Rothia sp. ZJ932]|uniref:hypothetical protein n=1 Tax=Rothia sp. ZJ932 TaxID=2810516 RepID=UPI00196748F7|nr:hypothetical protein [Rothia sp. ZJ932]QRZ60821.1 hypothetical protein JR346_05880 [Rothia sp. ZJ932]